jgi:hypothetical protein
VRGGRQVPVGKLLARAHGSVAWLCQGRQAREVEDVWAIVFL